MEPLLPGLTDYSQLQLFWIRNAHRWCSVHSKSFLKNSLKDVHTPDKYRLLGSMMLSDEFAKDFRCSKNSTMNPVKYCLVGSLWPNSPLKGLKIAKNTKKNTKTWENVGVQIENTAIHSCLIALGLYFLVY